MAVHCFFCGNLVGEAGCALCGTIRTARDERRVRAPCPRCGEHARLAPFGLGDAALQACPRCKGMFVSAIDWDTLLDVFSQEPLPDVVVPDAEGVSSYGPYRSAPTSNREPIDLEPEVHCPTCADTMERLEFGVMTHVVIDVCPAHGVWLDAGELERIIDSKHPHAQPPDPIGNPQLDSWYVPPKTLAEAAKEPMTTPRPPTVEGATFVAPVPSPAPNVHFNLRDDGHLPWTMQLRRSLGRLLDMIVSRR